MNWIDEHIIEGEHIIETDGLRPRRGRPGIESWARRDAKARVA